jgi:hypothetical protein
MNAYDDLALMVGITGPSPLTPAMQAKLRERASSAIGRARSRGLPYDPNLYSVLCDMYVAQQGRCARSHLPFGLLVFGDGRARQPFSPSPDRLDCQGGYVRGNVRLVLAGVNFARNRWGDDVLMTIAIGLTYADAGEPV